MSRIKLSKLILKNFKGIKDLELTFTNLTNIKGDNGTGKSTVFDAFTWLLFDKDSNDRQNFEIKTLDSKNAAIHGLQHEVTGFLNIDSMDIKITKVFKEKWTKKKGEAERLLTGHETLYYVNDVPVKQAEYKDTISKFINEQLFKLISNPLYFSTSLKWQERRNVIMEIIGDIPTDTILSCKSNLKALIPLFKGTDIDTFKKFIAARKRKLNEEIKSIPYRIDELDNSLQEIDFNTIENEILHNEIKLKNIEEKLLDFSKFNDEIAEEKNKLYDLKNKLREIELKVKNEDDERYRQLKYKSDMANYEIEILNRKIADEIKRRDELFKKSKELEKLNESLKIKWFEINNKELQFDEKQFICPTCNRPIEEHAAENRKHELIENFALEKTKNLKKITQEGISNKNRIEEYEKEIKVLDLSIAALKEMLNKEEVVKYGSIEELNNFTPSEKLHSSEEYVKIKEQIKQQEIKIGQPVEKYQHIDALKITKSELLKTLEDGKKQLHIKEQNERIKERIKELLKEEKELSKQMADLEKQEILCDEYIKTKVELLESAINNKFKYVKFKLFNTLVNGAIEDCCEALINGVPFSNANKASQINGGLDIINALCLHYGVEAPIFIDNREGVNEIVSCKSQIINLAVSKDKALVIEEEAVSLKEPKYTEENGPGF